VYCQFKKKRLEERGRVRLDHPRQREGTLKCLESLLVWLLKDITNELAPQQFDTEYFAETVCSAFWTTFSKA
jgi:hypothetical protein